jgi:TPR repeat protein
MKLINRNMIELTIIIMTSSDSSDDLFQQGYGYFKQKNYAQAMPLFQLAVSQGHPDATFFLARMHRYSLGLPMNTNEAQRLFQLIPDHPLAMLELGGSYLCGIGADRDYAKGKDCYDQIISRYSTSSSKLALEAVAKSMACLAWIHQYSCGVPPNLDKAIELYLKGYQYAIAADCVDEYVTEYMSSMSNCQPLKLAEYFHRLITEVETLRHENQELKRTNQALQTQLDYSPDGPGYHQAQDEFYALANQNQKHSS